MRERKRDQLSLSKTQKRKIFIHKNRKNRSLTLASLSLASKIFTFSLSHIQQHQPSFTVRTTRTDSLFLLIFVYFITMLLFVFKSICLSWFWREWRFALLSVTLIFFFPFFCLIFLVNGFVGLFSLMGIFGLWLSIAGDSVGIGFVLLLYVWPFWWDPKNRTF